MRPGSAAQVEKLATSHQEIQQLNEELRRQIEGPLARLMEALLRGTGARKGGQVVPGKLLSEHYLVLHPSAAARWARSTRSSAFATNVVSLPKVLSEQGRSYGADALCPRRPDPRPTRSSQPGLDRRHRHHRGWHALSGYGAGAAPPIKLCRPLPRAEKAIPSCNKSPGACAIHLRGIVHRDLKPPMS